MSSKAQQYIFQQNYTNRYPHHHLNPPVSSPNHTNTNSIHHLSPNIFPHLTAENPSNSPLHHTMPPKRSPNALPSSSSNNNNSSSSRALAPSSATSSATDKLRTVYEALTAKENQSVVRSVAIFGVSGGFLFPGSGGRLVWVVFLFGVGEWMGWMGWKG